MSESEAGQGRWVAVFERLNDTGTMWIAVAQRGTETAMFEAQTLDAARRHRSEFIRRENAPTPTGGG